MIHIYTSVSTLAYFSPGPILLRCSPRSRCILLWLQRRARLFYGVFSLQSASGARKCSRTLTTNCCVWILLLRLLLNNRVRTARIETKDAVTAKVRWSWLCRSGKVRGWHFNCAYVIYGACRASLAKQFETETQFIGLGRSSDPERGKAFNCAEEWRISTDKQTYRLPLRGRKECSVLDAPWSPPWPYSAEWQRDVILLSKAEVWSDSVTLPLNQWIGFVLLSFLWPLKIIWDKEIGRLGATRGTHYLQKYPVPFKCLVETKCGLIGLRI